MPPTSCYAIFYFFALSTVSQAPLALYLAARNVCPNCATSRCTHAPTAPSQDSKAWHGPPAEPYLFPRRHHGQPHMPQPLTESSRTSISRRPTVLRLTLPHPTSSHHPTSPISPLRALPCLIRHTHPISPAGAAIISKRCQISLFGKLSQSSLVKQMYPQIRGGHCSRRDRRSHHGSL